MANSARTDAGCTGAVRIASAVLRLGCLIMLPSMAGAANQGALEPSSQTTVLGTTVELSLEIAFDDATLGGGIVIEPAPGLGFGGFEFAAVFPDDPLFRLVCPDASDSRCDDFTGPGALVAFGSITGISGSHTVGTLTLDAVEGGAWAVSMREDDAQGIAGPFQPVVGGSFTSPSFSDATVVVTTLVPSLSARAVLALVGLFLASGAWLLRERSEAERALRCKGAGAGRG